ncbi:PRTRC system protein F [Paraburkholderia sediminicola]|uniref:PRTRC system protein F n=1 Tax=Paraburkholderia sediminicola TaxID=458836 RepID=UPI0038BAE80F
MTFAALALPTLEAVPAAYAIRSGESFVRPLALSMLDSGVIVEADVQRRPKSEAALVAEALTRRWARITEGMRLFDWNLRIEQAPEGYFGDRTKSADHFWAMIQTTGGAVSCRHVCIGGAMQALEAVREGLGQTVLAALYDALNMLPTVCTPHFMLGLAEYMYWYGESNEAYAIDEAMQIHDVKTREELLTLTDFFTRSQFFAGMPEWAALPRRVLTRNQITRAANSDPLAREVVDAMTTIWGIACHYGPFADLRSGDVGADLIDFGLVVRWSEDDVAGRIIDDYAHQACEGEYLEASAVTPLKIVGGDLADWLKHMEATALLAKAVEHLLTIFMRDEFAAPKKLIRVLV